MTRLLILIAVLGVFWGQAIASFQVYRIPSITGDYAQQTVTIDNENQIANIHVYGGSCSSDTIFDYKHFSLNAIKTHANSCFGSNGRGYIATRLFSRRACFVYKMEKGYIPELDLIGRLAFEKQMLNKMFSPKNIWLKYVPSHSFFGEIKEWLVFGSSIEKLCSGVPVYKVERVEKAPGAGLCAKAGILGILGISICGDINL